VIKRRIVIPRQGAKIENELALPRVIRRGNFRITEMPYPVYPKMRLTSIRLIGPHVSDMEGIVIIRSNILQRRHQRARTWPHL
jgi:hypothetical protein